MTRSDIGLSPEKRIYDRCNRAWAPATSLLFRRIGLESAGER